MTVRVTDGGRAANPRPCLCPIYRWERWRDGVAAGMDRMVGTADDVPTVQPIAGSEGYVVTHERLIETNTLLLRIAELEQRAIAAEREGEEIRQSLRQILTVAKNARVAAKEH